METGAPVTIIYRINTDTIAANGTACIGNTSSNGPHRLVLQDAASTNAVGIELKPVDGIRIGKLPIGAKMILRNMTVARGMLLLTPDCVTVLGGKIESLDQEWRRMRKTRLLERVQDTGESSTNSGPGQ